MTPSDDYAGLIAGNGLGANYIARLRDPRWHPSERMPCNRVTLDVLLGQDRKRVLTVVCPDCGGTFPKRSSKGPQRCPACSHERRLANQRRYDRKTKLSTVRSTP